MLLICPLNMNTLTKCLTIAILIACIFAGFLLLTKIAVAPINISQAATNEHEVDFIMPELKSICASESTGNWKNEPRQWDNQGNVLRGRVNKSDIGQCQINLAVWGEKATELGLDIFSFNGNRMMANWIYERYGNQPWYLSKPMWNK